MSALRVLLLGAAFAVAGTARAAEAHVAGIVADIRECVAHLKAADPEVAPMAFWDFDGTIIKGDVSVGLVENGKTCYRGLLEEVITSGWVPIYQGADAYRTWKKDYDRMTEIGPWLAQAYDAQMFGGVSSDALDAFCQKKIEEQHYERWYFASTMAIWKALAEAGVENFVVSANMEALVRNLAPTLGVTRGHVKGSRSDEVGGRWTTRIHYPVPVGDGKIEAVRQIVGTQPHGVAVAGFGNSYVTDAAFLRYIETQTLPGDAKPVSVMINGGDVPAAYKGCFRLVKQDECCGDGDSGGRK